MESVKILFANNTVGSGKTSLSLALANYIAHLSGQPGNLNYKVTLFECGGSHFLFNKRQHEQQIKEFIPSFEIIPLKTEDPHYLTNGINLIQDQEAVYIFDLPSTIDTTTLFNLIINCNIIISPLIFTDMGIYETANFILYLQKTFKLLREKKVNIPEIILIPNMLPNEGIEENIRKHWDVKTQAFLPYCTLTPEINWIDNLLDDLTTKEWMPIYKDNLNPSFEVILDSIFQTYKKHHEQSAK